MRPETMPDQTPTRLADYCPADFQIDRVHLVFDLAPQATRVRATLAMRRTGAEGADLVLDGRKLTLVSAAIDGDDVTDRLIATHEDIRLSGPLPELFTWTCETEIDPEANTELEGLYLSKAMFCTQCEAEGFRKITYFLDRPDVMATYTVRIEADLIDQPVLLSNGNPVNQGRLPGGRHFAEWHDPHPKPSYLFALVAGNLVSHDDTFTTASGRLVDLKIWVRPGDENKCAYAMDALIRSMRWDEDAYGREYDLDLFQIVAVDDFNMGAMENKGLNIFNAKYVLASPETATDQDFALIEGIIAHEYFHNWTGNRITCRDWFQLCLKEGLTVFRDQQFSADMRSEPVQRIQDVQALRARQFPEDAGPLAHPVRPTEYVEINNFYTATVYEKGAEIIRMLHTLVGPDAYRKGTDLYFDRHDGQACTIEDWITVFEDATGRDLDQFARWYHQAGTPRVAVADAWDNGTLTLHLTQRHTPMPGQNTKDPLLIPLRIGVIAADGTEPVQSFVYELDQGEAKIDLDGLGPERPTVSVNRAFSAPVTIEYARPRRDLVRLIAADTDPFNRWEAARRLALDIAADHLRDGTAIPENWADALGRLLADTNLDPAFRALAIGVPGDEEISQEEARDARLANPDAIRETVSALSRSIGTALAPVLSATYDAMAVPGPYTPDAAAAGKRALRLQCLNLLLAGGGTDAQNAAATHFDTADNMTDQIGALRLLVDFAVPGTEDRLQAFHQQWQHDTLVMDKWLRVQAMAKRSDTLAKVQTLTGHSSFVWQNPNKFRALIGAFAIANPVAFHAADGSGYRFTADWLLKLDAVNPQTTARLTTAFESLRRYTTDRQDLMRAELIRMAEQTDLSKNTREMVERILG